MSFREIYDTCDLAMIERFVSTGWEEDINLEFKTVSNADFSQASDRKNLAKEISAFANSAGGIIVWGINARKGDDDIDRAQALVAITPINVFLNRLRELSSMAINPALDGIEHRSIARPDGSGFALTFVPESISTPHMAKMGDDRYYRRVGTSAFKMEHFELEDMFGRRQKPKLKLEWKFQEAQFPSQKMSFTLYNEGRSSAKYAGCFFFFAGDVTIEGMSPDISNASGQNDGRPRAHYSDDTSVIHPNGIGRYVGWIGFHRVNPHVTSELTVRVYCDGMRFQDVTIPIPALLEP